MAGPEMALFGDIKLLRSICPECGDKSFVVDGYHVCCDVPLTVTTEIPRPKRESATGGRDRRSPGTIKRLLYEQDHKCLYCDEPITDQTAQYEHFLPWIFIESTGLTVAREENMVASCVQCNRVKRALVFATLDDARAYIIAARRTAK